MVNVCDIQVMKPLLSQHGFHFSKAKGQNFLIAPWVPQSIAEQAGVDETAGVLEIGPGIGPLTQQLCLRAGKVCAVEVDTRLQPILKETLAPFSNVEILWGDVLKLDIPKLVAEKFPGLRPMACANLPYYITTPILSALLEAECFESVTVMVQKEVAQRIAAAPGTEDYGAFSVFCQYYTQPELLFDVPPNCFLPQPKVETNNNHGTGCTLSAAIATGLGHGLPLQVAVTRAQEFLNLALRKSYAPGKGCGPVNHAARRQTSLQN